MKLAIIGLPQSGKSTVFNALTGSASKLPVSAGRVEVHSAMVDVPDHRLEKLTQLFESKKIVHAQIAFADVAGFGSGKGGENLSSQLLNALSGMDGLILVLRAFEDDKVAHPNGSVNPERDMQAILDDLMLNDLMAIERKQERLAETRQKAGVDLSSLEREQVLINRLSESLNAGIPIRQQSVTADERVSIAGLSLLTQKPILAILNVGEGQAETPMQEFEIPIVSLQGKLEMDLAQLPAEEASEFLKEYGLEESAGMRIIRAAYELLNIQRFYTVEVSEAHAWMLAKGSTALKAADTVHSDIARGFIRAEILHADELLELGSRANAREVGKLRLEGKSYVMQDGDVINVRFNV